jgi:hypothetical protein
MIPGLKLDLDDRRSRIVSRGSIDTNCNQSRTILDWQPQQRCKTHQLLGSMIRRILLLMVTSLLLLDGLYGAYVVTQQAGQARRCRAQWKRLSGHLADKAFPFAQNVLRYLITFVKVTVVSLNAIRG